ncbi:MAG: hypothetical protein KAQ97_02020 [Candidatus Fermentibacteraceae bacterium]|nr:hypothetical protein [Candidatus Fermentibacteraceae bacterium]
MATKKAVELRHEGRTYRADSRETFFKWAKEHRISRDDSYRIAGTEKWIPVTSNSELEMLLDPDNWWKIKMGSNTYIAPDWDTIVKWAKEGRLSTEVQIDGPKTPPGGILGKASPELTPHLRELAPEEPEETQVRLRFDGRTFLPGNIDTLRRWIKESRIPFEAEVSLPGGDWQSISDCQYCEKELWPDAAVEPAESDIPAVSESKFEPPDTGIIPESPPVAEIDESEEVISSDNGESQAHAFENIEETDEDEGIPYRIRTTYGEDYSFEQSSEVMSLLNRKRIHSFDEIRHPDLPEGTMSVSEFIEVYRLKRGTYFVFLILAIVFGLAGTAALVFQKQDAQWMMIGGIAALSIAFIMLVRVIWKR